MSIRSTTEPAKRPKRVYGSEPAEEQHRDGDRRAREREHEPGERDVLHPRAGERDDLPGEEEAVVVVAAEAAERPGPQRERDGAHGLSQQLAQRLDRRLDRPELVGLERAEPLREPRGAPLAHASGGARSPSGVSSSPTRRRSTVERTRTSEPGAARAGRPGRRAPAARSPPPRPGPAASGRGCP